MTTNGTMGEAVKMISNSFSKQPDVCGPSCSVKCWKWDVSQITMKKAIASNVKYGILILNRPIPQNPGFVKRLWNNAAIRMTVDGGTKRWDKFLNNLSDDMKKGIKNPDLITGDFDSITDEILEKYKKKGCKTLYSGDGHGETEIAGVSTSVKSSFISKSNNCTIHTPDQNHTDFTKALIELNIYSNRIGMEMSHVIVIAQTSGRLDQILGNIQTLFLVKDKFLLSPNTNVYLMSDDSLSWLLFPGDHVIYVPEESRNYKRACCSLVPIGEACRYVTTTGLKWNLANQPLNFGGIVSTSNTFDGSEKVTVKCSETLLWTMKVPTIMIP